MSFSVFMRVYIDTCHWLDPEFEMRRQIRIRGRVPSCQLELKSHIHKRHLIGKQDNNAITKRTSTEPVGDIEAGGLSNAIQCNSRVIDVAKEMIYSNLV